MSELVDAYQNWLGIPSEELPPNHYRLLGLELFEADRPTIDAAAKRLMGMLQKQLSGPDHQSVRKLLDEISDARRSLLLADRKSAYDGRLRAEIDANQAAEASDAAEAAEPIDEPEPRPAEIELAAVEATEPEAEPVLLAEEAAAETDDGVDPEQYEEVDEPTALEQPGESAAHPEPKFATPSAAPAAVPAKPAAKPSPQPQPAAAKTRPTAPVVAAKPAEKPAEKPVDKPIATKPIAAVAANDSHAWEDSEPAPDDGEIDGSFFSGMGLSSVRSATAQSSSAGAATGPTAANGKSAGNVAGGQKTSKSISAKTNPKIPAAAKLAPGESQSEGTSTVKKAAKRGPEMWQIMVGVGGAVLVLILVVAAMSGGGPSTQTTATPPAAVVRDQPHIKFGPSIVTGPIDDRTTLSPVSGASATVPLERHGDLMLVDVKINDQEAGKFLVDTGTRDLVISKTLADKLNLPSRRSRNMKMPGGMQDVTERKIESLTMGPVRFEQKMILPPPRNEEWLAIGADLTPWAKAIDLPIAGVIGGEVWSQVPFMIDPKHDAITFYKRGPFPFSSGLTPEFLTKFDNFLKPAISASLDQGAEGTYLVATGAPAELMVKGSAAAVNTLHAFGQEISQPATVESKEGDGYFNSDDVRQSGVIGAGILSHYLLMFDYANEKFLAVPIKK